MSEGPAGRRGCWLWWLVGCVALGPPGGCAVIDHQENRPPSFALATSVSTPLGQALGRQRPAQAAAGRSAVRLLVDGADAYATRAALADAAQRTLDLQYYVIHDDATADRLLAHVWAAAERGVRVRVLIDDLHIASYCGSALGMLSRHPNVAVRLFNPFLFRGVTLFSRGVELLLNRGRLDRRMHNKMWVADNAVAVAGGRNLGDVYFDASSTGAFSDLDVLVAGPAVPALSANFDSYWNDRWAISIDLVDPWHATAGSTYEPSALGVAPLASARAVEEVVARLEAGNGAAVYAPVTVFADEPGKADGAAGRRNAGIFTQLRLMAEAARAEVLLVSPYFVPSERSEELLCALTQRGVRVAVLTNSLASTDVIAAYAGYARHRATLLTCGVELYEWRASAAAPVERGFGRGSSLHAKAVVVDRQTMVVGSMNLDPRSLSLNTEVALAIDSMELAGGLASLFDATTRGEQVYRVTRELGEDGTPVIRWLLPRADGGFLS